MKVGVLLNNLAAQIGGGHTFENEMFQGLSRLAEISNHHFVVFTKSKIVSEARSHTNLEIVPIGGSTRFKAKVQAGTKYLLRGLAPWQKKQLAPKPWLERIILAHNVDMMWYPTPGAATWEVPYITVVWDLQHRLQPYFPEVSAGREWESRERSYEITLQRATAIITGAQAGKREIERFYQIAPERIHILPHPTPSFALNPPPIDDQAILDKYHISPGYLFYPAQFWPHKNHAGLFAAAKILKEQYDFKPAIVLSGADQGNRSYIEDLARQQGLADQVHFLGFVEIAELPALYRQALATTYVTYFGPENLPPLEAFALGCPVVASDVSGSEEQLADAALRVPPQDPQAIAQAIASVRSGTDLRKTLIEKGYDRATRFQGDDFVKGVFKILDDFRHVRACWKPAA